MGSVTRARGYQRANPEKGYDDGSQRGDAPTCSEGTGPVEPAAAKGPRQDGTVSPPCVGATTGYHDDAQNWGDGSLATSDFAQKGEDGSPAASDDSPGKSGKKRRKRGPNLRIEEVAAAMERLGGDCSIDAVYAELGNHGSLSTITSMVSRIRAGDVPDRLLGLAQMPGILEARELGIRLVEFIYGRAREQFRQGREAAAAFALEVRDSCASESGALRSRIGELERDLRSLGDALAKERELRLRAEQDLVELRAELIAARAEARRLQAAIGKIASGTPAGTGIGGVLMALAGAGQEVGGD